MRLRVRSDNSDQPARPVLRSHRPRRRAGSLEPSAPGWAVGLLVLLMTAALLEVTGRLRRHWVLAALLGLTAAVLWNEIKSVAFDPLAVDAAATWTAASEASWLGFHDGLLWGSWKSLSSLAVQIFHAFTPLVGTAPVSARAAAVLTALLALAAIYALGHRAAGRAGAALALRARVAHRRVSRRRRRGWLAAGFGTGGGALLPTRCMHASPMPRPPGSSCSALRRACSRSRSRRGCPARCWSSSSSALACAVPQQRPRVVAAGVLAAVVFLIPHLASTANQNDGRMFANLDARAVVARNAEFPAGEHGAPTAAALARDPLGGRKVSLSGYVFSEHSVPQVLAGTMTGASEASRPSTATDRAGVLGIHRLRRRAGRCAVRAAAAAPAAARAADTACRGADALHRVADGVRAGGGGRAAVAGDARLRGDPRLRGRAARTPAVRAADGEARRAAAAFSPRQDGRGAARRARPSPRMRVVHLLPHARMLGGTERTVIDLLAAPRARARGATGRVPAARSGPGLSTRRRCSAHAPGACSPVPRFPPSCAGDPTSCTAGCCREISSAPRLKPLVPGASLITSERHSHADIGHGRALLERAVAHAEDVGTGNSSAVRDAVLGRLPRRADRFRVVVPGVAARVAGAAPRPTTAVMVGRAHPVKDHLTALRAWRRVVDQRPDERLTIVGGGAGVPRLQQRRAGSRPGRGRGLSRGRRSRRRTWQERRSSSRPHERRDSRERPWRRWRPACPWFAPPWAGSRNCAARRSRSRRSDDDAALATHVLDWLEDPVALAGAAAAATGTAERFSPAVCHATYARLYAELLERAVKSIPARSARAMITGTSLRLNVAL